MQYMLLIYTTEDAYSGWSEEQMKEIIGRYEEFAAEQTAAGRYVDALRLDTSKKVRTVRIREGGGTGATDGPFAETKELLAGYFVLECSSRDEAVEQAKKIPGAEHGTVEVRGVIDLPALLGRA